MRYFFYSYFLSTIKIKPELSRRESIVRCTSSLSSLKIAYILLSTLSFLGVKVHAEWKVTNDTDKAIVLVADQSESIAIPAGQTKVFALKPHETFHKYCIKKHFDIYLEDKESKQDIFYKKYTLVERSCSDDLKENTFTMTQIAQINPALKERFVIQSFEKPTPISQAK